MECYRVYSGTTLQEETWTLLVDGIAQVDTKTVDNMLVVPNPTPLIRYQYSDHLGSATMETNENGQLISYEEYHPYGTTAYSTYVNGSYSTKRYRFTNKERDDETGLYYFGVRYYAAWLGRWTSSDPGGFIDGLNLYVYVRNNPIKLIDEEGYFSEDYKEKEIAPELSSEDDPPEGFTEYKDQNGKAFFLQNERTSHIEFIDSGKFSDSGEVFSFRYKGEFYFSMQDENKKFIGYATPTSDNKYKYFDMRLPDVKLNFTGKYGTSGKVLSQKIGATISPDGGEEIIFGAVMTGPIADDKVGFIQTVIIEDPNYSLYDVRNSKNNGNYIFPNRGNIKKGTTVNGNKISTFVDAGAYSPVGDLGTGFFYGKREQDGPDGVGSGITYLYDAPTAQKSFKKVSFETIAVSVDSHGIILLGSFKWGWDDYGKTPTGAAKTGIPSKLEPVSQEAIDILKKDYPKQNIFK